MTKEIQITEKQKVFADTYLETGNKTQAALKAYDTTSISTAHALAQANLDNIKVREYLDIAAKPAVSMIFQLSQHGEAESVRLAASKDILDRAGYKPVEKVQSVSVEIKGDMDDYQRMEDVRLKYEEELRNKYIDDTI